MIIWLHRVEMLLVEYKQYEGITFFAIPEPLQPHLDWPRPFKNYPKIARFWLSNFDRYENGCIDNQYKIIQNNFIKSSFTEKIIGCGFDATASNKVAHKGSCTILQDLLQGQLLWLACRHHILELVLKKPYSSSLVTQLDQRKAFSNSLSLSGIPKTSQTYPFLPSLLLTKQKYRISSPSSTPAWNLTAATSVRIANHWLAMRTVY